MASDGDSVDLTFVFKQEGEKLSGTYPGPFGKPQVTGRVKGDRAMFGSDIKVPDDKPPVTAAFTGTIESPTKMTGTVGSPFCGAGCKGNPLIKLQQLADLIHQRFGVKPSISHVLRIQQLAGISRIPGSRAKRVTAL